MKSFLKEHDYFHDPLHFSIDISKLFWLKQWLFDFPAAKGSKMKNSWLPFLNNSIKVLKSCRNHFKSCSFISNYHKTINNTTWFQSIFAEIKKKIRIDIKHLSVDLIVVPSSGWMPLENHTDSTLKYRCIWMFHTDPASITICSLIKNFNSLCSHSSPQWIGEISVSGIWPWFIGGIRQDFIYENILKRKRSRPFNSTFVSHQTCLYGEKSFVKLSYELFTGLLSNLWVRFYYTVLFPVCTKRINLSDFYIKIEIIQKKVMICCCM